MNESNINGLSVRAIIAVVLVLACVALAFMKIPSDETLKYLVVSVISFYFGNKTPPVTLPPASTVEPPSPIVALKTPIVEEAPSAKLNP
jgi:hypothetical protein